LVRRRQRDRPKTALIHRFTNRAGRASPQRFGRRLPSASAQVGETGATLVLPFSIAITAMTTGRRSLAVYCELRRATCRLALARPCNDVLAELLRRPLAVDDPLLKCEVFRRHVHALDRKALIRVAVGLC
jgi:hypothetical protein